MCNVQIKEEKKIARKYKKGDEKREEKINGYQRETGSMSCRQRWRLFAI